MMLTLFRILLSVLPGMLVLCLGPVAAVASAAQSQTQVDVMLLFDARAAKMLRKSKRSADEMAREAMIQLNEVLANSPMPDGQPLANKVSFNLAHYEVLSYPGKAVASPQANKERSADINYMIHDSYVRDLRERYHADLVVMFAGYDISGSGILGCAHALPELCFSNSPSAIQDEYFCALFSLGCLIRKDLTYAHETCHLLMCGHSDVQLSQSGPQLQPDSSGYMMRDSDGFPLIATLMTYETGWYEFGNSFAFSVPGLNLLFLRGNEPVYRLQKGEAVENVPFLSGPYTLEATYKGKRLEIPMGDARHNNVRNMLTFAPMVASYRLNGKEKTPGDAFAEAQDMGVPMQPFAPIVNRVREVQRGDLVEGLGELESDMCRAIEQKNTEFFSQFRDAVFNVLGKINAVKSYDNIPEQIKQELDITQSPFSSYAVGQKGEPWYWLWGSNRAAEREPGEPAVHPQAAGKTVWYRFVPEHDGVAHFKARRWQSNIEVLAAAYTGDSVGSLTPAEELHVTPAAELRGQEATDFSCVGTFHVRRGKEVFLAVDSREQEGGFFNLSFYVEAKELPPPPDGTEKPTGETPGGTDKPTGETPGGTDKPTGETPAPSTSPTTQSGGGNILLLVMGLLTLGFAGGMAVALYKLHQLTHNTATPNMGAAGGGVRISGTLSNGLPFDCRLSLQQLAAVRNFTIGSARRCGLVVPDASVEACHAVFKVRQGQLLLGDAGSRSGTVVNGRLLHGDECVQVTGACNCRLGGALLTVSPELPQAAAPGGGIAYGHGAAAPPQVLCLSCVLSDGKRQDYTVRLADIAAVRNYTIGRALDNRLIIADPTVSGHHAVLKVRQGKLLMGDVGSSSGTVIDGVTLHQDDCVTVKRTTMGRLGEVQFSIYMK